MALQPYCRGRQPHVELSGWVVLWGIRVASAQLFSQVVLEPGDRLCPAFPTPTPNPAPYPFSLYTGFSVDHIFFRASPDSCVTNLTAPLPTFKSLSDVIEELKPPWVRSFHLPLQCFPITQNYSDPDLSVTPEQGSLFLPV